MRQTRRRTTRPTDESSNSPSDTVLLDGQTTSPGPDESEDLTDVNEEAADHGPQTLDDIPTPRRGMIDRMLRPIRMDERIWGGRTMFVCPHCKAETFNSEVARKHRC